MIDRRHLIEHLEWVLRPPVIQGWFVDQIEQAIELAAAGRTEEVIEVDCKRRAVDEVVEIWELEELVEQVREGRTQAQAAVQPDSQRPSPEAEPYF